MTVLARWPQLGVEEEDAVVVCGGCALKTWHDDGGGKVPRGTAGRPCPSIQWESHMEEEPFQNAAVEVRILLWIIYELRRGEKKSAIDSSCASNGFGL